MEDDFDSYVVVLVGSGDAEPFAHYLGNADATRHARKHVNTPGIERAHVFGVATTGTRAAFSAVMNGDAELVDSIVHGTFQAQIGADHKRAWEQALQGGIDAIRKFLGR